jgi:hypothetical protein
MKIPFFDAFKRLAAAAPAPAYAHRGPLGVRSGGALLPGSNRSMAWGCSAECRRLMRKNRLRRAGVGADHR